MDKSKINMHKRMAMGMREGGMGGRSGSMMYSRGYGVGEKNKRMPTMLKDRGPTNMKKGGKVHKAMLGAMMMKKAKKAGAKGVEMLSPMAMLKRIAGKKAGGKVQGYRAREDESLGMRRGKESGKKQTMADRRNESYGKFGRRPNQKINRMGGGVAEAARKVRASGMKKGGKAPKPGSYEYYLLNRPKHSPKPIKPSKMKRGGNTRRMNRLEELGRVDAEKARTSRGRRNLKAEKRRIVRELKK
jgi:hypothetical protein